MAGDRPYVWQMLRAGIHELGPTTTNVQLRDWVLRKWPGTNPNTVGAQIAICTVNHRSRIHYPENQRPRIANTKMDFLFRPGRGQLELYDPARHGTWEIVELPDGERTVRQVADAGGTGGGDEQPGGDGERAGFAAEDHLRDFLAQHLEQLEPGLEVYAGPEDEDGVEYDTGEVGRIDILAVAKQGDLVVIELKVGRGQDAVVGQVLRYIGWVRKHLAGSRKVRGIVVAHEISDSLRYAIGMVPDVALRTYALAISFAAVEPHR